MYSQVKINIILQETAFFFSVSVLLETGIVKYVFHINVKKLKINTRMCKKFCNILLPASLQHVYHMTKAVQAVEITDCI